MAKPTGRPIRDEVLTSASTMVQRVGVNGLSYGVLARELGISSPSIHHHFRTKDDLIAAVVTRHRADFSALVATIDDAQSVDAIERIEAFAGLFDATVGREAMCLCGSVASDWAAVGEIARAQVAAFFDDQVRWLAARLADASTAGLIRVRVDVEASARLLLAALEGAVLLARAGDNAAMPSAMARQFLSAIST